MLAPLGLTPSASASDLTLVRPGANFQQKVFAWTLVYIHSTVHVYIRECISVSLTWTWKRKIITLTAIERTNVKHTLAHTLQTPLVEPII